MRKEELPSFRIFVCAIEKAPGKAQCLKDEGEKCVTWLREEIRRLGLQEKVWVTRTKCQSYCAPEGTSILFEPSHKQYSGVKFEDLPALLKENLPY